MTQCTILYRFLDTATLPDLLYSMCVLILCVLCVQLLLRFEKGTYAKRLGKVYQSEFKTTPPDNLLEKARAFPFVKMEK